MSIHSHAQTHIQGARADVPAYLFVYVWILYLYFVRIMLKWSNVSLDKIHNNFESSEVFGNHGYQVTDLFIMWMA